MLLRLYPRGRAEHQVNFEMQILTHLAGRGCRVPEPLREKKGALLSDVEGRIAVWTSYLPGQALSQGPAHRLPPEALKELLDPVYLALEDFRAPFSKVAETRVFRRRFPSLLQLLERERPQLLRQVSDLFSRLSVWESALDLPSSTLHADVHPGNVLQDEEGNLWLVDFDDAHVGHRVTDWILPCLEFAFDERGQFDETRYQSLLSALVPERATPSERASMPRYRSLLTLKFAVALADLGDPLETNRYLTLLEACDFSD